ncbi:MAG TPA: hypothetical protein VIR03_02805 [Candidatus Saccharimonadales bacterium]
MATKHSPTKAMTDFDKINQRFDRLDKIEAEQAKIREEAEKIGFSLSA